MEKKMLASTPKPTKPKRRKKVRIPHLFEMKQQGIPIAMTTAYDFPTGRLAEESGMDVVLVGDSLGNVVLGMDSTLGVNMEMMVHHTRAVKQGLESPLLVADMPFMSFSVSPEQAVANAGRLIQEGGAEAVKVEGAGDRLEAIRRIIAADIPVMGHLGLTPQSVNTIGGYRVQGREEQQVKNLIRDARSLQHIGVFAIVLELTTDDAVKQVMDEIDIPVIGIGAGNQCDGQVLVMHDLLGLSPVKPPKFAKQYANLWQTALDGLSEFKSEVKDRSFPTKENSYE
jgi:3-methyl-2-oxobutanoate hydroxymethyltransferase